MFRVTASHFLPTKNKNCGCNLDVFFSRLHFFWVTVSHYLRDGLIFLWLTVSLFSDLIAGIAPCPRVFVTSGRWSPRDHLQPPHRGKGKRYGWGDAFCRPLVRVALHLRRAHQASQRSGERRRFSVAAGALLYRTLKKDNKIKITPRITRGDSK